MMREEARKWNGDLPSLRIHLPVIPSFIVDLRINETLQTGAVFNRPYRSPVW